MPPSPSPLDDVLASQRKRKAASAHVSALLAHPAVVAAQAKVEATAASPLVAKAAALEQTPAVQAAIDLASHPVNQEHAALVAAGDPAASVLADHPAVVALAAAQQAPDVQQYNAVASTPEVQAHLAAATDPQLQALHDAQQTAAGKPASKRPVWGGASDATARNRALKSSTQRTKSPAGASRGTTGDKNMVGTGKISSMGVSQAFTAGQTSDIRVRPQVAGYKVKRLVVDQTAAANFVITDMKIGNKSQCAATGDQPASIYHTLAIWELDWDVCDGSTDIILTVRNTDSGAAHTFLGSLIGEEHSASGN